MMFWNSTVYRGPSPDLVKQHETDVIEAINTQFLTEGQATYKDLIDRYVMYGDENDLKRALDKVAL